MSAFKNPLLAAIKETAVLRGQDQRLVSPSGSQNKWLIDMRRLCTNAAALDLMAGVFWDMFENKLPFQIGGMEVAAIPILSAILMKSVTRGTPINGFIVRKERKLSGTGSSTEGEISDLPIIIVDDVLNSGASLEKVRAVLEQQNRHISSVFVYVDYHSTKGMAWRRENEIEVIAPFGLSDLDLELKQKAAPLPPIFLNEWRFISPDPNFSSRVPKSFPTTDGERVYFGSDCGFFWCLNARNGQMVWKFRVHTTGHKNIWSAPALHDGKVFFGAYDGNVYCLEAATGKEVWRFTEADWVGSSPAIAPELGLLFIGLEFATEGRRGSIIALDLESGARVWEHFTKRYTHASPAYWPERKLVACGSNDNEMFLLDAVTGQMKWRFETKGGAEKGSIRHAPAFDPKRNCVVTGCADGYIYIIDVETGREVWSVKTDNTIYTVPLVVGDRAYVGSTDKHLYILDLEKKSVIKKIFAASKIYGPPRLIQDKIYFGACNGLIYQVDSSTGDVSGTHQLPDAITNAMVYSEATKLFYALTYTNELYALAPIIT